MTKQDFLRYDYDVEKYNFTRAGEASSAIKNRLKKLGLNPHIIRKIAIASYEAEINIIIHSDGGTLSLLIHPMMIKIIAHDKGPGIEDIQLAMKEGYSTAPDTAREYGFGAGMGLSNIKRYCDDLKIESAKGKDTIITMDFRLDAEGEENEDK